INTAIRSVLTYTLLGVFCTETVTTAQTLKIGRASTDITPTQPVLIQGQFHARLSEGVKDPLTATALAMESTKGGQPVRLILISLDLISVADGLRDDSDLRKEVRELVVKALPELKPTDISMN